MRQLTFKSMVLALALFLALGASFGVREAEARKKEKKWDGPLLSNYELYQIGAAELVLGLSGRRLPDPELSFEGNEVRLVLRNSRVDKSNMTNHSAVTPLVSEMSVNQVSDDVVMHFLTTAPLQLRSKRGAAPSNDYTFRMIAAEEMQRVVDEPVKTRPKVQPPQPASPFSMKTPITLDLRDTELRDVFRMLGTHLKKNVIIDPSLPPALVTMTLKNVPMSEAFEYLVKTYDITYHMVGKDTIVIGTQDGLSKLAGNEEARMFKIAYGDLNTVQQLIVNLTKLPADRFVADVRQRAIYVTSTPAKLMEVSNIIQKLDKPNKQVMIYAKIFEFTDGATREVETAINAVYNHWWFSYTGVGGGRAGFIDDNRLGRNLSIRNEDAAILPNMTDLQTPMHGIWREFDVALRAVENKNQGRTLANPSVITIDGQEATIRLTEDYPYISDRDDAGNPTWSTQTVGPQLKLTPRVARDGRVNLDLTIETGEVIEMITGSTGEQMPRTSTRNVTTHVTVSNGEPFVVGGLFSDTKTRQRTRVPVLGYIPLLGELFTFRNDINRKSQVVMLVVPYILDTPDAAVEQELLMRSKR